MDGFLQSLKTNCLKRQILFCGEAGKRDKQRSIDTWKKEQIEV